MKTLGCLLSILMLGCATMPIRNGIPNLASVVPGIYRGGQPDASGWAWLRAQGVTNVIKLNEESEGSDAECERLGMIVHRYPISLEEQTIGKPPAFKLHGAAANIKPGTFVHCSHGQDRTGLVIAAWRVANGWHKETAKTEMILHGFHPLLRGLMWSWEQDVP